MPAGSSSRIEIAESVYVIVGLKDDVLDVRGFMIRGGAVEEVAVTVVD